LRLFTGRDRFSDDTVAAGDFNKDGVVEMIGTYTMNAGEGLFDPDLPRRSVTLVWETFSKAVTQCGLARLYAGVHISDANLRGQAMGRAAGALAYARARTLWEGTKARGATDF
jgi:hypothetical protein